MLSDPYLRLVVVFNNIGYATNLKTGWGSHSLFKKVRLKTLWLEIIRILRIGNHADTIFSVCFLLNLPYILLCKFPEKEDLDYAFDFIGRSWCR